MASNISQTQNTEDLLHAKTNERRKDKMTLKKFQEILKVAEEIAVTSINPQDEVLDYFRNNGINATPEMAFEFVDEAVGRFEEAQVNF